jgi:hypothetical protein
LLSPTLKEAGAYLLVQTPDLLRQIPHRGCAVEMGQELAAVIEPLMLSGWQ